MRAIITVGPQIVEHGLVHGQGNADRKKVTNTGTSTPAGGASPNLLEMSVLAEPTGGRSSSKPLVLSERRPNKRARDSGDSVPPMEGSRKRKGVVRLYSEAVEKKDNPRKGASQGTLRN